MSTWRSLTTEITAAITAAAPSIVQVHGRRRVHAGVVIANHLLATTAATPEDTVSILADGHSIEGHVLGRSAGSGLTIIRAEGLDRPALPIAPEPLPGHLAVAVGRTWSGAVMAAVAPVAVVGGPLRTGRSSSLERVIRVQQAPHGALTGGALIDSDGALLGLITAFAIRGTTVVIPARIVANEAARMHREGGATQGYLGIGSLPVALPERQRAGRTHESGLLITQVAPDSPAEQAGLLIGDVIVAFDGDAVPDADQLLIRLRGDRIGRGVPLTVIRGTQPVDVTVTVAERPRFRG